MRAVPIGNRILPICFSGFLYGAENTLTCALVSCRQWALGQGLDRKAAKLPKSQVPSIVKDGCEAEEAGPARPSVAVQQPNSQQAYFAVNLFVAALGEGKLILEGTRKKQDILEQVVRNVSKEQNTIVNVPGEGTTLHLKMRVFVENSIEAKAVGDYIASHPNQASEAMRVPHAALYRCMHVCIALTRPRVQNPAPFVILSRKLHMAVSYNSKDLDTSCASVADRLRKQAKTRAVKILREAIADPVCGATTRILRGLGGAHDDSLGLCLDRYLSIRM